ncbi:MAG TPA: AEC family transporter [Ignavibacteria bacterium]|nr:AEC family transporter [Ignavibacteria bacterium]
MVIKLQVFESVVSFAVIVFVIVILKKKEVLKEEWSGIFSSLITQIVIPVIIFSQLAFNQIDTRHLIVVLCMFIAGIVSVLLAYTAGKLIKLERSKIGALIISSSFGSSTLLGYPLISQIFPNDPAAMSDAIFISELGVGLPIFIIAPFVAMIFGSSSETKISVSEIILKYFRSPIFISLVLGIIISMVHLDVKNPYIAPLTAAADMIKNSMSFLACIILGLIIKVSFNKKLIFLLLISIIIQSVLQPFIATRFALLFNTGQLEYNVLLILSSMPSAILGTVFANKYNCSAGLTAELSFYNILLSILIIPLMFQFLGIG